MNFHSQIFFNDISHSYKAAIFKKTSLRVLPSYMVVGKIDIIKRRTERAHCNCIVLP